MVKGSAGAQKVARGILETSGVKSNGARKLLFKMEGALAILGLPEMPKRKFLFLPNESRTLLGGFETALLNDEGGRRHSAKSFAAGLPYDQNDG